MTKTVLQISKLSDEVVAEYFSISDAERATGINNSNIVQCCKGKVKSAVGFKWRYKDE